MTVGDKVTIKKPRNLEEHPRWVSGMNGYDGKTVTVTLIDGCQFEVAERFGSGVYSFRITWIKHEKNVGPCPCKWRHCRKKVTSSGI